MRVMRHVETGQQTGSGQVVVQREQCLAHEGRRLEISKYMRDEVTRVSIAGVPVLVNSPRSRLAWAVIVDNDFVHAEDSQGPGDATGGCYPLVCGFQTGSSQQVFDTLGRHGTDAQLLCNDAARHGD